LATAISIGIGTIVGLVSGYAGGLVDEIIVFLTLFLNILPGLVLLLILASILGPSFWNIVWIIGLIGWTGVTLIVRAQTRGERNKAYVMSARAIGASDVVILFRHILPNVTPLLFAVAGPSVAGAILSEAALSFLGLSDPTVVSWGKVLERAYGTGAVSNGAWWMVLFPGAFLAAISSAFVFMGYTVDRILNPRLRQR
jgi:peptide/nickel transport system permease protein